MTDTPLASPSLNWVAIVTTYHFGLASPGCDLCQYSDHSVRWQ